MLYLSRKIGESIIINNSIELTVTEIKGKSVKLGFQFPSDASVLRKEIHDKIMAENIAATQGDFSADDFLSLDESDFEKAFSTTQGNAGSETSGDSEPS